METKTIGDIEATERIKQDPYFEASKIPEIVQKKDVGYRLTDYWCDAIMPAGEWFQISREENKIIIQPVIISYPESNRC